MSQQIQLTNRIPSASTSNSRPRLRLGLPRVQPIWIIRGFLLIPVALALALFALSPAARAVVPEPDGGYPNQNTAEGTDALFNLTTGIGNTAVGFDALFSNTTGRRNTANGDRALFSNTTGHGNTAMGLRALFRNTTGIGNTANGVDALFSNTTGFFNTANGNFALLSNTTGNQNTANGVGALFSNTTGYDNLANGFDTLNINTTGFFNTANGDFALFSNTTGHDNTADGFGALTSNTVGHDNTAEGVNALLNNSVGSGNISLGANAGSSLTIGNNNIDIGNTGGAGESNAIRIGTRGTHTHTFIAGISGATVAGGVGVIVDTNGHLGTVVSSERLKDQIKPMDKASEAILALKPVTFRYKQETDPEGIPQFGLVAEQVEKVNPDLVARNADGKVYTVRYDAVNAMLLNEFLKEHRKVERLEASVVQQEKNSQAKASKQQREIDSLKAALKEQAALIQNVSAQLEASKTGLQLVANNR